MVDKRASAGKVDDDRLKPPPAMRARLDDVIPQLRKLDSEQIRDLFQQSLYSVGVGIMRTIGACTVILERGSADKVIADLVQELLKADAQIRKLQGDEDDDDGE